MRFLTLAAGLLLAAGIAFAQDEPQPPGTPKGEEKEQAKPEPAVSMTPEDIARQIDMLGSRYLTDRVAACKSVAKVGKSALPYLRSALKEGNMYQRMNAVELLGSLKEPESVFTILEMSGSPSMSIRAAAQRAIDRYGSDLFEVLNKMIESGQVDESKLPDDVVAKLYRGVLVKLFSEVDTGGQYPGQYATIARLGPKAIPSLLSLMDDSLEGRRTVTGGVTAIVSALADFKDDRVIKRLEGLWEFLERRRAENMANSSLEQTTAVTLAKLGADKQFKKLLEAQLEEAKKNPSPSTYQNVAILYHHVGQYDKSQLWFLRAAESAGMAGYIHHYNLACAYAMGKKLDKAVEALAIAIKNGYANFEWMVKDKELDAIRNEAGYIELLKKHCPQFLPENLKKEQENEGGKDPGEKPGEDQ
jgi:tetratricopeptide (TPR) repeat protein